MFHAEDDDAIFAYGQLCEASNDNHDSTDVYIWEHAVDNHSFLDGRFTAKRVLERYKELLKLRKVSRSQPGRQIETSSEVREEDGDEHNEDTQPANDSRGKRTDYEKTSRYSPEETKKCVGLLCKG